MKPEKLTVPAIEKAIGIKARKWEGDCLGVVLNILKAKLVKGRPAYGLWWGGMAGRWADRHDTPTHHGWIVLPDGRILDPTRWSFEAVTPYIWIGEPTTDYDEGSNRLRTLTLSPRPEFNDTDKKVELVLQGRARAFLVELLGNPPAITEKHLMWLANLPPEHLGFPKQIYRALVEAGYSAFIPIDNRKRILEEL